MLKRVFLTALCGTLFLSTPIRTLAEEITPADGTGYNPDGLIIEDPSDAVGIKVDYHPIEDIRNYVASNGPSYLKPFYATEPDTENAPFAAGELSSETLNDALKAVNTIRYIAGLDYNVTLNSTYTAKVQAGALVNELNGKISHDPSKPAGIDDNLYQLGLEGNGEANLASGFASLASAVTNGWLNDGDANNIEKIGHRRWLLNAVMKQTGFGQVGNMTGMYAFDKSGTAAKTSNVWPAQNTPLEFFGSDYPWSVSTGKAENINNVSVSMTNVKTNQTLTFSKNNTENGYFNVDNGNSGVPGTVIWRPNNITYADGDCYDIVIFGLSTGEISYSVNFFQLYENDSMSVSPSSMEIGVGETAIINASFVPASSTDYLASASSSFTVPQPFSTKVSAQDNTVTVTGLAEGSGTITMTSNNGLTATCEVKVVKKAVPVTGVSLSADKLDLYRGETAKLNASVLPADADNKQIVWTSSDTNVAAVDANGLVTAKKAGSAVITAASAENGAIKSECAVTVQNSVLVYGGSLALGGKIGINFFLDMDSDELANMSVKLTMNDNVKTVPASEGTERVISGTTYMMYEYPVAAKEMRETVTLTVVDKDGKAVKLIKDGTDYTEGYPYSASEYFARVEEVGQERTKKLTRVTDNYGKYTQIYFDYKVTDDVKSVKDVSAVTVDTLEPYQAKMTDVTVDGLSYAGGSAMLDDAVGYRLYFKVASGYDIKNYTFTIDNKAVTPTKSGSQYFVEVADIAAKDLGVMNTIKVSDGTKTFSIQYSALSYARRVLELTGEDRVPLQNMCRAMYLYNQQAIEYFNTK